MFTTASTRLAGPLSPNLVPGDYMPFGRGGAALGSVVRARRPVRLHPSRDQWLGRRRIAGRLYADRLDHACLLDRHSSAGVAGRDESSS
jgi:hypothetical protein